LQASFEPADAQYAAVWDAIKKSAKDAGIGQPVAGAAPVAAPATLGK
jgi:hypothetical protein